MIPAAAVDSNNDDVNDAENRSDSESTTSSKNSDSNLSYQQKREANIKKNYERLTFLGLVSTKKLSSPSPGRRVTESDPEYQPISGDETETEKELGKKKKTRTINRRPESGDEIETDNNMRMKSTTTKSSAKRSRTAERFEEKEKIRNNKGEKATPRRSNSSKEENYKISSIFFFFYLS